MTTHRDVSQIGLVRVAAYTMAALFTVVGVLGFIPGVTTNYSALEFAGPDSNAMLLGVFAVSVLHNLVHLAFGVAGAAMGRTVTGARAYLIGGGLVYAALWIYGLVVGKHTAANFVPLNDADNWLHLGLAIAMIALGALLSTHLGRTRASDIS